MFYLRCLCCPNADRTGHHEFEIPPGSPLRCPKCESTLESGRVAFISIEQIYESWIEVSATNQRPDDSIHRICEMIHILRNMGDALEVPETKTERRERAKWNHKRRKGQDHET